MAHKPTQKKKKRRLKKPIRIFLRLSSVSLCILALTGLQAKFDLWNTLSNSNLLEVLAQGMDFQFIENTESQVETIPSIQDLPLIEEPASNPAPALEAEPIATILVDPGHGGIDSGTIAKNPYNENEMVYESTINLQAAYDFKECMAQINPQIRVVLTRQGEQSTIDEGLEEFDEVTDLNNRVAMIDQYQANYFLSLHCNASKNSNLYGYELFVKSSDQFSNTLVNYIKAEFDQIHWPLGNGVLWTDYYPLHVVDYAKVPAMLVEMGYMSHEGELTNLMNTDSRRSLMYGLAKAYSDCILAHSSLFTPTT